MSSNAKTSPRAIFEEHCERGELAYQVTAGGTPVFYPRVAAPGTGDTALEWRVSEGLGTVYATTTVCPRGREPYDVSLVDLDEGFRMMSRIEGIDPMDVVIGMRVRMRMIPATEDAPAYPVFDPAEEG